MNKLIHYTTTATCDKPHPRGPLRNQRAPAVQHVARRVAWCAACGGNCGADPFGIVANLQFYQSKLPLTCKFLKCARSISDGGRFGLPYIRRTLTAISIQSAYAFSSTYTHCSIDRWRDGYSSSSPSSFLSLSPLPLTGFVGEPLAAAVAAFRGAVFFQSGSFK